MTLLTNSVFQKNQASVLILLEILAYVLVGSREYTDPRQKMRARMTWREFMESCPIFVGVMNAPLIALKQPVDSSSSVHGLKEKLAAERLI